jgi:SAM-dependent methyltransferase
MEELKILDQTAHLLGNYHKYYTFHSTESRINLLREKNAFFDLWKAQKEPEHFYYLDIGCNEGDLSYEVVKLIRSQCPSHVQVHLVGVDIDGDLIKLAREKISLQTIDGIFENVDFTNVTGVEAFRSKIKTEMNISSFNLISVFSTTMWIHINHGDEGLTQFFERVNTFLRPEDGTLLLEPQPAKCYTNAARRCRKMRIEYPPFLETVDRSKSQDLILQIIKEKMALPSSISFGKEEWGRSLTLFFPEGLEIVSRCELKSKS